jgi:hypothetical protein
VVDDPERDPWAAVLATGLRSLTLEPGGLQSPAQFRPPCLARSADPDSCREHAPGPSVP